MWPSQSGKLNAEPLTNKEITAIRLDRDTVLLEAFIEDLVRQGTTVPLFRDRVYNTKLDTIPEEDSQEEKDNNTTKLKDNIFNVLTTLKKYINLTAIVGEGKNRSHF